MKHITIGLFCQSITLCIFGEEHCLSLKNRTSDKAKNKILKMTDNGYKLLQQMQCLCFSPIFQSLTLLTWLFVAPKVHRSTCNPGNTWKSMEKRDSGHDLWSFLLHTLNMNVFLQWKYQQPRAFFGFQCDIQYYFGACFFSPSPSCSSEILEEDSQLASFYQMGPLPTALLRWGEATQPPSGVSGSQDKGKKNSPPPNNRQRISTATTN